MAHVYHWRHGWIPLDHVAALSKAKGNHERATAMLRDAHGPGAGIHTRQHLAGAIHDLPNVSSRDAMTARHEIRSAADKLGVDSLPGNKAAPADLRNLSDADLANHLGGASDPAELDRIVTELDRRDVADKRKQQAAARQANRDRAREADYDKRIEAGDDPEQAYEDVYGVSVAKQRQQGAIASMREQGYRGAGFHELSAAAYRDHVNEQMVAAEAGTRGAIFNGLTRANETRNMRRLFTDERYARAHASEELRRWWQDNGGFLTLADYRASILGGHAQTGRSAWY